MRADIQLQLRCIPDQLHWESHQSDPLTDYCVVCCVQEAQEGADVFWVQVSGGGWIVYKDVEVYQHLVKSFCCLNEVVCCECVEMYQLFGEVNYSCVFVCPNVNVMIYVCVQYVQHTWRMSQTDYCHCYCLVY